MEIPAAGPAESVTKSGTDANDLLILLAGAAGDGNEAPGGGATAHAAGGEPSAQDVSALAAASTDAVPLPPAPPAKRPRLDHAESASSAGPWVQQPIAEQTAAAQPSAVVPAQQSVAATGPPMAAPTSLASSYSGNIQVAGMIDRGDNSGPRRFMCDWEGCTYQSSGSGHMKRHIRTHTGERPYVCSWPGCRYSASQSGHLVQHMRSHTGERPFKCEVPGCDYAASRSGHLKRHMRVHIADAAAVPADFTGTGLEAAHAQATADMKKPPVDPNAPQRPATSTQWRSQPPASRGSQVL